LSLSLFSVSSVSRWFNLFAFPAVCFPVPAVQWRNCRSGSTLAHSRRFCVNSAAVPASPPRKSRISAAASPVPADQCGGNAANFANLEINFVGFGHA